MNSSPARETPLWVQILRGIVITVVMILLSSWWTNLEAQWLKGTMVESVLNWLTTAWLWFVCSVMVLALIWAALDKCLNPKR